MLLPIRRFALLLTLVALSACDSGQQGSARPSRGILLVTVDGLVPAHLATFGGPIALTHFDRLVDEGRGWSRGWSAAPMTRPAAATYLTGVAPDRHRVLDDRTDVLDPLLESLPGALQRAGYRTAAFLDNSALGRDSGLHAAFEAVDDPLPPQFVERRWVPAMRDAAEIPEGLAAWLDTLGDGDRFFAWVHLSRPLRAQMSETAEAAQRALDAFDTTLGRLVAAADSAAGGRADIVVAGTFGLVAGTPLTPPGPGMSVSEEALTVPVVWRGPALDTGWRDADALVWMPDVTQTLAEVAGLEPIGEGWPLSTTPDTRDLVAYARAAHDQMGWVGSAAARRGSVRVEIGLREGSRDLSGGTPDPEAARVLHETLTARRPIPLPPPVDVDAARAILEEAGVALDPAPLEGRPVPEAQAARAALDLLWMARRQVMLGEYGEGLRALGGVLQRDPFALSPLIDRGFIVAANFDRQAGEQLVVRAAATYPHSAEVLRWYAATVHEENHELSGKLLELVAAARPGDADVRYDLACVAALDGDLEEAERRLRVAIEAGFRDFDLMTRDADLRALRESGVLERVVRDYQ